MENRVAYKKTMCIYLSFLGNTTSEVPQTQTHYGQHNFILGSKSLKIKNKLRTIPASELMNEGHMGALCLLSTVSSGSISCLSNRPWIELDYKMSLPSLMRQKNFRLIRKVKLWSRAHWKLTNVHAYCWHGQKKCDNTFTFSTTLFIRRCYQ